ncbi:hypothetical protein E4U42_008063, partial [Claviceps africana]
MHPALDAFVHAARRDDDLRLATCDLRLVIVPAFISVQPPTTIPSDLVCIICVACIFSVFSVACVVLHLHADEPATTETVVQEPAPVLERVRELQPAA